MTDSLLPQAPSMDEPLEMLEACHGRIEAQLGTLELLLVHLPAHGADEQARQAARNVLRYFELAGTKHHEDEERDLFPRLLARAGKDNAVDLRTLIDELLAEHAEMACALEVVRQQLLRIADGSSAELGPPEVHHLSDLYRQHIQKENRWLFPLSKQLLTPLDQQALSEAMVARRRSAS